MAVPARSPLIQEFLNGLDDPFVLARLFEDLPEIECFVKDTHGRRLYVSSGIWRRLGFSSGTEMVGKSDNDLFPPHIADQYRRSDEQVLESGQPSVGLLEVWITEQGVFDWFVVNKYPVQGKGGRVIGIMGVLRAAEKTRRGLLQDTPIGRVSGYLRAHFSEATPMADLARVAGLSESQLRRRFLEEFGMGMAEFVIKLRTHAAADALLKSDKALADIAQETGFCDQSAFTRAFRAQMGMTPRAYRFQYGNGSQGPV
jgi:PAS domain S-box-containing protein